MRVVPTLPWHAAATSLSNALNPRIGNAALI